MPRLVPRLDRYVPQHRANLPRAPRSARPTARLAGAAVLATGLAVSSGGLLDARQGASAQQSAPGDAPQPVHRLSLDDLGAHPAAPIVAADTLLPGRDDRREPVSRSGGRTAVAAATPPGTRRDPRPSERDTTPTAPVREPVPADPRDVARGMLAEFGFSSAEFPCLDALWASESDWDPTADNPSSSAYGIPQALTGGTHDDLPSDYLTNATSQIRWGLGYVRASYGTPCAAWDFKQANGWY